MRQNIRQEEPIDNSLGVINNNSHEQLQLNDFTLNNKKLTTKIDSNKHFSCIYVYQDRVYMGTRNSKLYIYKVQVNFQNQKDCDLKLQKVITPHCQVVSLIVANDKYFVTVPESDQDSMISIWETKNKMLITALKGHKSQISQAIFLKNNKYLVTASWDCSVRVWGLENLQNDDPVRIYTGNYPILVLREFNQDILVFGGDDCYLVFWNWKKNQIIKKQFGHAGSVTFIEVIGSSIFSAGGDNKFKLWQVTQTEQQQQQQVQKQKFTIKKVQQQKQQYDSIIFGCLVDKNLIMIDRQGEMFVFTKTKQLNHLKNFFQYNQNITGIDAIGYNLFVTTTKGALKHFNVKETNKNDKEYNSSSLQSDNFQIVLKIKKMESLLKN